MAMQIVRDVSFRVAPDQLAVFEVKLFASEDDGPAMANLALVVKKATGALDVDEVLDHRSDHLGGQAAVPCLKKHADFLTGGAAMNAPVGRNEAFIGEVPGMRGMAAAAALLVKAVRINRQSGRTEDAVSRQQGEGA